MTADEQIEMLRLVKETHTIVTNLEKRLAAPAAKPAATSTAEVADDYDLDGRYGDEEIRKMPSAKYWAGDGFTGSKMSECPVEFLDAFAKYKDACAYMGAKEGNPEKEKYVGYDKKSAARARGWAKRLRAGWVAPAGSAEESPPADSDSVPF